MANPFFDVEYYIANNADVVEVLGTDRDALENHYLAHGADEGRKPASWFDADFYRANNSDLAGLADNQLFEHFANYGVNELRSPAEGVTLDAATFQAYADENSDVVEFLGIADPAALTNEDVAKLAEHFFQYGINEERPGSPELPGEPIDTSALTEALVAYQDAVDAERAFLEDVAENNDDVTGVTEDSTNTEIENAVDAAVTVTTGEVSTQLTALAAALTAADETDAAATIDAYATAFPGSSASVKAEIIAEAQEEAAGLVSDAQAEVAKISGQLAKVNALVSSKAAYEDALEATVTAEEQADAELLKFNALSGETSAAIVRTSSADYEVGTFIAVENNVLRITDAGQDIDGIDAMFAAAQAEYQALRAEEAAEANFEARLLSAHNGEADTDVTDASTLYTETAGEVELTATFETGASNSAALLDARELQAELAEAVGDYEAIAAVVADLEALGNGVTEAAEAIEELGFELAEVTAGGAGSPDTAAGTDSDDLFVFAENDLSIANFGLEGTDVLFIGDEFSEFRVATGDDAVTDRLGDATVLEIFFQQDGNNAVLYIENEAFAGNATTGDDLSVITLAGVNVEDLAFDQGYVQFIG